jgi:hypothetical protein
MSNCAATWIEEKQNVTASVSTASAAVDLEAVRYFG